MSYALDRLSQLEEEGEAPSQVAPGRQTLTSRLAPRPLDQRPRDAGEPSDRLPAPVQAQMGAAFGLHLGGVSVERDSTFATSVGAEAVAHDGRLHFAPGMYDPGSTSGLSLIGHEVAHLAQQTDGRASQAQAKGEGESPELEAEAEALGSRAAAGEVGLLGDGTLRTPARSSAVQRRPTRWADINENGVGVVWAPHKTKANLAGRALGSGAEVDGAPKANIDYRLPSASGGRGVQATNLGRDVPVVAGALGVSPAAAFGARGYVDRALLPLAHGGSGGAENVIALPPDAAAALDKLHAAITTLTANGFVNVRVVVNEEDDLDVGLSYAARVRARWAQVSAGGGEAASSVGEYMVNLPRPTGVDNGQASTRHPTLVFGGINQASLAGAPAVRPDARKAELQTVIDFGAATGEGDGTRMRAEPLGADHGIGEQPTDGVWKARTGVLHNAAGKRIRYIAGHLLNHHLGGPGNDPRNLTPIPEDVNHEHEAKVEAPVKALVRAGHWVSYEVAITHAHDAATGVNYPSQMVGTWAQLDAAGQVIATTRKQVALPIAPPSAYSGAPNQPGKKTPKLASSNVVGAGVDADNRIGATTTLGFHEVMLEDTATLGPQVKVMKPLVAALVAMGLNAHFHEDPHLGQDVFTAMAAVKPSPEECEARLAVEERTQELRELTVEADVEGADAVMDELRDQLQRFVDEIGRRANDTLAAAAPLLFGQYASERAADFGGLLSAEADRALRDLRLTEQSTRAAIDFAQRMLHQHQAVLHLDEHPMSPGQALQVADDELQYNDEDDQEPAHGAVDAERQLRRRRMGGPDEMLFHAPERRHGDQQVLELIAGWRARGGGAWPFVDGAPLSAPAATVGRSIEGLLRSHADDAVLTMVMGSLYQTNTRAFLEYAEWLDANLTAGPDLGASSSDQGGGYDDDYGGYDDDGGSPDYGGLDDD